MYIFSDVALASKPYIIKVSFNSNLAIIWVNIWDSQNSSIVKSIVNQYFNIRKFITTICRTNVNPGVPQYKNCWKSGHLTLTCQSHVFRYAKYNRPHNTECYREKIWYCKENKKTNSPRLATKTDELCPHIFKCVNYKGDYQVDSNIYSY